MCILPWNATVDWIFWEYWGVNGLPAYRGAFDVLLPQIPRCLMVAERVLAHGMSQISWHGLGYTEQQTVDIGTFSPLLVAPAFHPCDGHPEIMDISELFIHMASKSWLFVTSMMFHHDSLSRETSGPFTWKHYNYWFLDQVLSMLRSEWLFIAKSLDAKCLWHPSGWFVSPDSIMRMRSLFATWLFGLGLRRWKSKKR